jgi:hypothetical protein
MGIEHILALRPGCSRLGRGAPGARKARPPTVSPDPRFTSAFAARSRRQVSADAGCRACPLAGNGPAARRGHRPHPDSVSRRCSGCTARRCRRDCEPRPTREGRGPASCRVTLHRSVEGHAGERRAVVVGGRVLVGVGIEVLDGHEPQLAVGPRGVDEDLRLGDLDRIVGGVRRVQVVETDRPRPSSASQPLTRTYPAAAAASTSWTGRSRPALWRARSMAASPLEAGAAPPQAARAARPAIATRRGRFVL